MNILIQGLSMPDEGCHHTICIYSDGKVETGEPNSYQAIPVPPHGRLGDLDMVEAMIMEYIEEYGSTKDENGYYSEKWCAMKEAERIIQDAPTIIPAEGDMNRFPRDCWDKKCKHFHVTDMSVDDLLCACDVNGMEYDACDEDFSFVRCPLTEEGE